MIMLGSKMFKERARCHADIEHVEVETLVWSVHSLEIWTLDIFSHKIFNDLQT